MIEQGGWQKKKRKKKARLRGGKKAGEKGKKKEEKQRTETQGSAHRPRENRFHPRERGPRLVVQQVLSGREKMAVERRTGRQNPEKRKKSPPPRKAAGRRGKSKSSNLPKAAKKQNLLANTV